MLWSCALPTPPPPTPRILRAIAPIVAELRARPTHAGPIIAAGLRAARTLGSKERPVAGDLLLGMIRHERALARIDADPLAAWARLSDGVPDLDDPPDAYAVALSLPAEIADEWWERLGPEAAIALAKRQAGRAPVVLRLLREVAIDLPHRRVGPHAIVLEGRTNLDLLPAYRDGAIEVQDLGSQAIVDRAFPGKGARVLDMCAGAGGKSLALAAMGARVQAWDVRPAALEELRKRAARARLDVHIGPPKGRYDMVLVDAPCSGTGVLRRHPENRWKLRFPVEIQRELLERAFGMSDNVVYATCSLTRRENEDLVRQVSAPAWEETLWPTDDGEGFYMAGFQAR
jgi:16S rRNA (cytosine967-C5)-methyltransferase